jgi:hypothetical protein
MVNQMNTFDTMTAECLLPCAHYAVAQEWKHEMLDGITACHARVAFVGRQSDKAAVITMLPVVVLQKSIKSMVQDRRWRVASRLTVCLSHQTQSHLLPV